MGVLKVQMTSGINSSDDFTLVLSLKLFIQSEHSKNSKISHGQPQKILIFGPQWHQESIYLQLILRQNENFPTAKMGVVI